MRWWAALLATVLAASPAHAAPQDAVSAALKDAALLPPDVHRYVRYLTLNTTPEKYRADDVKAVANWINHLSREVEIVPPVVVGDLIRINLRDYKINPKTWEKFVFDPYFHVNLKAVKVDVEEEEEVEKSYETRMHNGLLWIWDHNAKVWIDARNWQKPRTYKTKQKVKKQQEKKLVAAAAPWLDAKEIGALVLLTQSQAPVLRADWWLAQTSRQISLDGLQTGVGYYDWLEVPDLKAFEKLVQFDRKISDELGFDKRAALEKSGVSSQNRRVKRRQSYTGGYWFTEDFKNSKNKGNVVRILDDNAEPDALEVYGVLPNGLFAYFLQDVKNNLRQDSAPDFIGPDDSPYRTGHDARIHVGIACLRCHKEGLRPVADWVRRTYRGPVKLSSPDYETFVELRKQYLSDLDGALARDRNVFAQAVKLANGLTLAENARVTAEMYNRYIEDAVTIDAAAREWDVKPEFMLDQFRKLAQKPAVVPVPGKKDPQGVQLDPLLVAFLTEDFEPLSRSHFEELYPLGMLAIRGLLAP